MNLLIIKATDRSVNDSVTAKMFDAFYEEVKGKEGVNVTVYDVYKEDMPYIGNDLFSAFGKLANREALTKEEERVLNATIKAKDAFAKADTICLAFPMWNLSVPANLKTYIDYVYQAGFTFSYDENGQMIQLMKNKNIILLNARGGYYSAEANVLDMSVNYVRNVFGMIFGMNITDEVIIEGHNARPDKAEEIINDGLYKIRNIAKKLK